MTSDICYQKIINWFIVVMIVSSFRHHLLVRPVNGYLDINQYCKAWDVNFRPIICILKNGTQGAPPNHHSSSPPPPPNYPPYPPPPHPTQYPILQPVPVDYTDSDEDDDECSCEVTCIPRIVHQRSIQNLYYNQFITMNRLKREISTNYRCKSCGTECPVSTTRRPTCNCVIPANRSQCSCTATCATFRFNPSYFQNGREDIDDANCILSVTALEDWRLGEERPPYTCDCKKSKESENTSKPDFICICQRDSSE